MVDVARRAGVSLKTVSRVVNNEPNVQQQLADRVRAALLITASSEEDPVRGERLLRDLCSRRVDGLLVVPAGADHAFLKPEVERGIPWCSSTGPVAGLRPTRCCWTIAAALRRAGNTLPHKDIGG